MLKFVCSETSFTKFRPLQSHRQHDTLESNRSCLRELNRGKEILLKKIADDVESIRARSKIEFERTASYIKKKEK